MSITYHLVIYRPININPCFEDWLLSPSLGEGRELPTLLSSLERTNPSNSCLKMLSFLKYRVCKNTAKLKCNMSPIKYLCKTAYPTIN
jgi:hypothetical protein